MPSQSEKVKSEQPRRSLLQEHLGVTADEAEKIREDMDRKKRSRQFLNILYGAELDARQAKEEESANRPATEQICQAIAAELPDAVAVILDAMGVRP
jgi:hypothetical protein